MATPNKKKVSKTETTKHLNWMGGASYFSSNPVQSLRLIASSCFFGEPQYYHKDSSVVGSRLTERQLTSLRERLNALDPQEWRSKSPQECMINAIDDALNHSVEQTLQEAVRLRQEDNIRTTPQVILVRAAHHKNAKGTGLVGKYGKDIVIRTDEPSVGLAYHIETYGKDAPIPNSLKKVWARYLEKRSEKDLAKYKMDTRGVKTVDVVNLVHPKRTPAIHKLVRGELKLEASTWESLISSNGSNCNTWTQAVDIMGHMALLRNVRNLLDNKVEQRLFLSKLVDGAKTGKQLPFRYYSAFRAIPDAPGTVKDAIEQCMEITMENVPNFSGRVMSLCDNSGSAQGTTTSSMGTMKVSTIANLTGCIVGAKADEGYVGVFGDRLDVMSIRKKSSIFDNLEKAETLAERVGQETENGIWLFWDKAIREKEHWDHVFVFSDLQAGHGGLYGINAQSYKDYAWDNGRHIDVSKLINAYRSKVNPLVNVYLVQVAGYKDTILPEFYDRTFILSGWGEGVLKFAGQMTSVMNQVSQKKAV